MLLIYNPLYMRGRTQLDQSKINDALEKPAFLIIDKQLKVRRKDNLEYIAEAELFVDRPAMLELIGLAIEKLIS